jgi:hypothetical protein
MRFLPKLLMGMTGMLAVAAIFLWAGHPDETETQAPILSASSHLTVASQSPEAVQIGSSQRPAQSLLETLALIRGELLQWRDAKSGGSADQEAQDRLTQEMLAMVTDENALEILHALSAEEMNTPFGVGVLRHAMQVDPVGITDWIASRTDTTEAQTLEVADDWISHPTGLEECIGQLPDTEWKQDFLGSLGSELSNTDPKTAIEVVQQMNPGQAQTYALQVVACNWVAANPDAALDWVAGVQDPALRDQLIASAVQSYAVTDPAQAATWLTAEVKSPQVVNDAALNILRTWVVKDPAQAAGWVAQFPDGSTKTAAVEIISQHWQQTDPSAAAAWIQNLSAESTISPN